MLRPIALATAASLAASLSVAVAAPLAPLPPLPTVAQLAWQDAEYGLFIRLDLTTFTGGRADPQQFNPAAWAKAAIDAGFRRVVLSANDGAGFCFWPTATTEFSIAHTAWRDGHGDVVREFVDACRAAKLEVGFAVGGYERGHAIPDDTLRAKLQELLGRYGPIAEVRLDGAGGEGTGALPALDPATAAARPRRDWPAIFAAIRALQPHAIIVSNIGPGARWNGNNIGHCGEPMWAPFDAGAVPGPELTDKAQLKVLNSGEPAGPAWIPAEAFIPLRPNWSWRAGDDAKLIAAERLFSAYCKSVGRNCSLLINVPLAPSGELPAADIAALDALHARVARQFAPNLAAGAHITASSVRDAVGEFAAANVLDGKAATAWAPRDDTAKDAWLELDFAQPVTFGFVELREPIAWGQRIATYRIEVPDGEGWKVLLRGKSIGRRKIERPPATTAAKIRIVIEDSRATPALGEVALYAP
jgi:alpha-L-fucosidase